MEDLKEIYERISFLRQKGIKMKEMAEQAGISPSVLSAIYSTVLPAYLKNTEKGENEDEALNNALVWVNNVSKKKLLGSLANLKNSLFAMEIIPKSPSENKINPFLTQLENNMQETLNRISYFSGIYLSYSISSGSHSLKIEPYLITPAATPLSSTSINWVKSPSYPFLATSMYEGQIYPLRNAFNRVYTNMVEQEDSR